MLDEKKSDIYKFLPQEYYPQTFLVTRLSEIEDIIQSNKLSLPVILKPNIGYKGVLVEKVEDWSQVTQVFEKFEGKEIIVQEFVDLKKEYALLFYKYPASGKYGISSLIEKSYPFIRSDGKSTIRELITNLKNPFLDKENLFQNMPSEYLQSVPMSGEKIEVEKIGNYSRGAKFHSRMDEINEEVIRVTHDLFRNVEGMNFFRIDFKADSLIAFQKGKYKILEVNGAKSEPLHIYDRQFSLTRVIKDIHLHWMIMNDIVEEAITADYIFPSTRVGWTSLKVAKKIGK